VIKTKERIDKLLVERALVSTRARAQAMILAGHVLVNDTPAKKAGEMVSLDATIRLREPELKYVSRGALKLKAAIEGLQIPVKGLVAIDVGASTGGFSELLLEYGASKIYTVDVGTNQLAWKLRNDPRLVVKENYNARHLLASDFPELMDIVVMDVSFISIKLILPALLAVTKNLSNWIVLFKPQFEVGREFIEDGGIVRDQDQAKKVMNEVIEWAKSIGLKLEASLDSPLLGTDGNHEYLLYWKKC
jgi:23S rRNA (cytidine1920-2'-O)/16S rRNA (cytidine1409-2'-O)-methyltransferase